MSSGRPDQNYYILINIPNPDGEFLFPCVISSTWLTEVEGDQKCYWPKGETGNDINPACPEFLPLALNHTPPQNNWKPVDYQVVETYGMLFMQFFY